MIPTVLVTAGDPCGVGPELLLKALGSSVPRGARIVVIGDLSVFRRAAARLKLRVPRWQLLDRATPLSDLQQPLGFVDLRHRRIFRPGHPTAQAGAAAVAYLKAAVSRLTRGEAQALVTAPVTKWAIQRAEPSFEGHTEYLAAACRVSHPVMAFVSPRLRVALLTRHMALRDVPPRVNPALVTTTVRLLAQGLQRQFGLRRPHLAICGLNPHAGEAGRFGREEQRVLAPALRRLRRDGVRIDGPFAADGFFVAGPSTGDTPSAAGRVPPRSAAWHGYDAVVCWYHDQGLIPFKLLARDTGCQITFGLPFVRTSPDHGSALDLAATGGAHPGSMRYALRLAIRLARQAHAKS